MLTAFTIFSREQMLRCVFHQVTVFYLTQKVTGYLTFNGSYHGGDFFAKDQS